MRALLRSSYDELPAPIHEHIKKMIADNYSRRLDENTVGVTELLYCLRKAYLRRKYERELLDEQKWWIYRGNIFHALWGSLFDQSEIQVVHEVGDFKIVGHADIVYEGCVYELKTVTSLSNIPKEHHIKQILAYAHFLGLDCAKLIYVSFDGFEVIEVPTEGAEEVVRELEERARVLINAVRTDTPPPAEPMGPWECEFCEVARFCGRPRL